MSYSKITASDGLSQEWRPGISVGQPIGDDDKAQQVMVQRLKKLHTRLQAEHGGLFPDSTPLIREMRDNPRRI